MDSAEAANEENVPAKSRRMSRRRFVSTTTATAVFTVVPRHVLGGANDVAPSEKITMAFIGVGWQGIWNLRTFLKMPDVRVVAVNDVNEAGPYMKRGWAGREPSRKTVNEYYAQQAQTGSAKDCAAYCDFREMLEERDDIDAVVIRADAKLHWDTRKMKFPNLAEAKRFVHHSYREGWSL